MSQNERKEVDSRNVGTKCKQVSLRKINFQLFGDDVHFLFEIF